MKFLDLFKSKVLFKGALFSAIFFSLLLATLVFAPGAKAGQNSPADFPDSTECAWVSDANINCGEGEFWFDLDLTVSKGRAMYHYRKDGQWKDAYIVFGDDGSSGQITNSADKLTDGTEASIIDREKRTLRRYAVNDDPNSPRDNGEVQAANAGAFVPGGSTGEQYFFCGIYAKADQKCWSGRGGVAKTVSAEAGTLLATISEDITATIESDENCTQDSGALGFVLCPMLKGIQNAIDALIGGDGSGQGFIVELLTIKPLDQATTPELYRGWEAVRNIALALYVLIFALIIFGNGVGYDPYTIKRALPRLAAGVVLTFASFFIMQTVIDVSNFLGNMVPAFVNWMSEGTAVTEFNFDVNFAYQGISIILIIVFAIVALGALLVGLAGLITRVVIIYGLVLLAPLAFLAWVLPNTEGMFKKWWKNLIKVAMMFPIVTGMLSLSIFFAKIMSQTASSTNNGVLAIAASLAPLIAIILIPKTFKWGGEAFAAAAGYMAGKATQGKDWGKGAAKDSANSGRIGQGLNAASKVPGLGRVPGIGGITNRQKAATVAKRQAAFDRRMSDGLDKVSDDNLLALHKTQKKRDGTLKSSPYAKAVDNELKARAGKARSNAAEDYRNGRFEDAGRAATKLHKINAALGISPTDTETTLSTMYSRIDKSTGGSPAPDLVNKAMGEAPSGGSGPSVAYKAGAAVGSVKRKWSQRGQGGYVDPSAWGASGSAGPAPTGGTSGGPSAGTSGSGTARPSGSPSGTTRPSGGGTTPPPGPTGGEPTPRSPWGPGGLGGPSGGASPAPTTPPPTGGPGYYGTGSGPVPSGGTGGPSPWSPPPAAPAAPGLPPMPAAPAAPATGGGSIPPATPVSVSAGSSTPTPVSAPAPATPSSSGGTTTIVNNNSVNQVFQQSGSLRSQMSGGGLEGYGDLMRKMDGIDAKLASGKVDTFALKKDLKNLRLARESAPESMHGQIDDYMRSAERAAGIPENAGSHDDVDLSEE